MWRAALGVLLVHRIALLIELQHVGEDGEADLQLGRRFRYRVPVVDPFQHRMTDRTAGDPSGEGRIAPDAP